MLTNCVLDLSQSAYRSFATAKTPVELYIPVRSGTSDRSKIQVLLATKDPAFMATFSEMQDFKSRHDAMAWAVKNTTRLYPHQDVKGLVRYGVDEKKGEREKLSGVQDNLAADFILLEDGAEPSLNSGLGFSGLGVLIVLGAVMYLRLNREPTAD